MSEKVKFMDSLLCMFSISISELCKCINLKLENLIKFENLKSLKI